MVSRATFHNLNDLRFDFGLTVVLLREGTARPTLPKRLTGSQDSVDPCSFARVSRLWMAVLGSPVEIFRDRVRVAFLVAASI